MDGDMRTLSAVDIPFFACVVRIACVSTAYLYKPAQNAKQASVDRQRSFSLASLKQHEGLCKYTIHTCF